MHIRELAGKTVSILGFGKEGRAMLAALEQFAPGCEVTVADQDASVTLPTGSRHWLQVGEGWLKNLEKFDIIIKSPGIPPSVLSTIHFPLISPTQIFLDSIKDTGATVIGVTGSKGKSTTASLITGILKAAGKNVFLVGNIGEPAIAHLKDAATNTIFVQEMSSYQLMDLTSSPHIAVVTAFFPEHLDYHGSMEAYKEAKKHITRFQTKDDCVFFAADSDGAEEIAGESKGRRIPFSAQDAPVAIGETILIGTHNLSNIAAAYAVAKRLGIPQDIAVKAIKGFIPLPHRLQSLGVIGGIEWVDDSISTTPESAIAALDALSDRVGTIILGGQDRGYDFSPLAKRLKNSKVQTVLLLPDSGATILKAIKHEKVAVECSEVKTMKEAVALAKKNGKWIMDNGKYPPVVLLSPASPSYGHFRNFEERGNAFKAEIDNL
ncbi:MAG: UDP-N-acetylmuramoyl-L-alanine--D-glutamate ligase [Candidatus Peribacteraceae bacterium]|nr:UDP-N-acetylmuramoyl-L-alanine--D-glutamate ligase [Candidatus Peribacteraceae bacterium]MDD5074988.1 UDP-N-acetylmuramoyl-L-alanine--D-glutamate ligase [Candidatus Peribacteraceae bacterium]